MEMTINSRKLGKKITFSRPGKHYVYVDFNGDSPGQLGKQICEGGSLMGDTITCRPDDQDYFEVICREWWKKYSRNK